MADVITRLRLETEEFHNRARRVTTDVQDMSHQLEVVGNRLNTTDPKMLKLSASFGKMQTVSTTLKGKISELESEFVAWSHLYNQLTDQQKREPFGRNIVRGLDEVRTRINQTKTELQGINSQLAGAGGSGFGAKFMQGLVPGFGMGAGAVAAMKAVQALGMLKQAVVDGVRTNMEFEQSNANLAAVLGKTRGEITALTENAKQLGATTLFTANQITELQTVLARRGFSENQILEMTKGISNLAVATGTNLADAAELAGSTMQAFGMHATEMNRITSVLGVSTTKSALTTEKLGTALQYVAPAAKAAGYSLEDVVAMLGVMVDAGLDASTAGTSLRQIIMSMSVENGKMAKSFGHPIRGMQDFVRAIDGVSNAEDLLSDASREVRITAVPALLALANNKDRLVELRGSLNDVNSELQKMANEQLNTLQGSVTILNSAWDGLMLTFSNSNGQLKSVVDYLTTILNKWREARALSQGGDGSIALFTQNSTRAKEDNQILGYTRRGIMGESNIRAAAEGDLATLERDIAYLTNVYNKWYKANELGFGSEQMQSFLGYYGDVLTRYNLGNDWETNEKFARLIGGKASQANVYRGIIDRFAPATTPVVQVTTSTDSPLAYTSPSGSTGKTPEERAAEMVENAVLRRQESIAKINIEDQAGLLDSGQLYRKMLNTEEQYMDALTSAAALVKGKYDDALTEQIEVVKGWSAELAGHTELQKKAKERLAEEERVAREAKAEALRLDGSLYSGINSAVGRTAWQRISELDDGSLKGRFLQMKGVEVPDDVWTKFVADLNEKLAELKLPAIQIDLETGAVVKTNDKLKEMVTRFGYVANAVESVGSALQTVGDMTEDPAAKIAGIVATAIASTALGFAQAATADSKYGTVAWIASAAAGLANMTAMVASIKQVRQEYHAEGGFVGMGGPRGTDTVNTWLTPGELVLNRAQQNNLAAQLAPAGGYGDLHMEKIITGEDIRIVLTNNARRRGGTGKNYAI